MWVVVVHAGAGFHSPTKAELYQQLLAEACFKAAENLSSKVETTTKESCGSSVACERALCALEDSPLTNAGFGSALNEHGFAELECAMMHGPSGGYGAIAAITNVKNPSMVAHHLLFKSLQQLPLGLISPSFLVGQGANKYAQEHNLGNVVVPDDLINESSKNLYAKHKRKLQEYLLSDNEANSANKIQKKATHSQYGTVGCVCIDAEGTITAGTSSGGISLKHTNRLGHKQSSQYGCGCWADLECGISTSGAGEDICKMLLAYEFARKLKDKESDGVELMNTMLSEFVNNVNPFLRNTEQKPRNAGIITLRQQRDEEDVIYELLIGHTTQSFAVGYFSSKCKKPTIILSRIENANHVGKIPTVIGKLFVESNKK